LAKVLGRQPIKPKYSSGKYVAEVRSQTLYELLKKPVDLDGLKKYIEHCERCMAAFLRGFIDSEGSVDKSGHIRITNTDYELLEYVKDLLKRLGIESTGPKPKHQQGTVARFRNGNYKRRKDGYYIYIRAGSNINFYKNIGFTIERKQKRLENYIRRRQPNPQSRTLYELLKKPIELERLKKSWLRTLGPRGEGHTPQGQEHEGRRKYLPRGLRIRLFDEVNRLRRDGLTYKEIIDEVWRRYGVKISKSSVSEWLNGIHKPYNGRYIPSIEFLEPSEELAYVMGVKIGDGCTTKGRRVVKNYNRVRIGLKVKDREFAEEFGRCLAKVLGRRPINPRYRKSLRRYVVEIRSQTLYELLKKPVDLDRLKP
jgi:intein-encoded DNA endonuclease-like protein